MSKSVIVLKCGKCENGTLDKEVTETNKSINVKIHKCNNCKYQYGFKESLDLEIVYP